MSEQNIFEKAASEAMANYFQSEKFTEFVTDQVESAVSGSIKSMFTWDSSFKKGLEAEVKKSFDIDFEALNLTQYNSMILELVKSRVDEKIKNEGLEHMEALIEDLVKTTKKDWKLSEIVDRIREDFQDKAYEEDWYEMTVIVEDSGSFKYVYIDPECEKEKYECRFSFSMYDGEFSWGSMKNTDKYGSSFSDKKELILGNFYGIEALLFSLHASKASIEIDQYNPNFRYED